MSPRGVELDQLVDKMTEYYSKPENLELHALKEVGISFENVKEFLYWCLQLLSYGIVPLSLHRLLLVKLLLHPLTMMRSGIEQKFCQLRKMNMILLSQKSHCIMATMEIVV